MNNQEPDNTEIEQPEKWPYRGLQHIHTEHPILQQYYKPW